MRTLLLTDLQLYFIRTACCLKDAVIQFDISDKDFEEDYGFTKDEILKSISDLKEQL